VSISWASGGSTRAGFLRVTIARALAADGACAGKLTAAAAVFVGIIANSIVFVFASRGVATRVVATAFCATTITFFVAFNDAVATLLASDCLHLPVVAQAVGLNIAVSNGAANVANSAGRELINALLT
jgi:hypothetical protein